MGDTSFNVNGRVAFSVEIAVGAKRNSKPRVWRGGLKTSQIIKFIGN